MKKFSLILFLAFLAVSVSAETVHTVEAGEQRIEVNSSIGLECTDRCPVNSWKFSYTLPDDSRVISVSDSLGQIEDYNLDGTNLEVETNEGAPRREEKLEINYVIETSPTVENGLYMRSISFPGFQDEQNSGKLRVDNLLSGRTTHGFQTSFNNDNLNFTGEGPVQVNFNFGQGLESGYYEFFSTPGIESNVNQSEDAYEVALGFVNNQNRFERIPVLIYGESYNTQGLEWSAGEYRAGTVRVKSSEEMRPVLAHETVHSLNDPLLNWDRTSSDWFDEGTARHVESLMRKQLYRNGETDRRPADLFGEDISYTDFDEGLDYTVSSKGDREELWNYYRDNRSFMMDWTPRNGNRDFGYAYSELIIKNFLINGGDLQGLYSEVDPGRVVESNDEKWNIYSNHMDLTPCKSNSRTEFDRCLDRINEHDFPVRKASPIDGPGSTIDVRDVELPEREHTWEDELNLWFQKIEEIIQRVVELWRS